MLNTSVNTKRILLDERVEMKVAVDPLMESTIYCRPFEEDVHNVSAFTVNGQEFVHNYITGVDNQKYIVTNVITEDGDIHEDVRFKIVIVEDGVLPMSVVNLRKSKEPTTFLKETAPAAAAPAPVQPPAIVTESVLFEKVKEYKKDLLTEFLTFSQVQQKFLAESLGELKGEIYEYAKDATEQAVNSIVHSDIKEQLAAHSDELVNAIKPHLEKTVSQWVKENVNSYEKLLTLDKRMDKLVTENAALQQTVNKLLNERQSLKAIIEGTRQYTDATVARYTQDAKDYARRILDLGGGGGSVAVQYANGGVMNGDLTINGNILSGGDNLVKVFAGEGGGDDNPINGGQY